MDQPMGDHDEKGSRQGPKSPEQAKGPSGPEPRLLDQVRNVMRLHHYSIHTDFKWLRAGLEFTGCWHKNPAWHLERSKLSFVR